MSAAAFRVPFWSRALMSIGRREKTHTLNSGDLLQDAKSPSQLTMRKQRIPSKLLARGSNQAPKYYSKFLSDGEEENEGGDTPDFDGK